MISEVWEHDLFCESYLEQGPRLPVLRCKCEYRRGRLDALQEALLAMNNHSFHNTAHDILRGLIRVEESGPNDEEN